MAKTGQGKPGDGGDPLDQDLLGGGIGGEEFEGSDGDPLTGGGEDLGGLGGDLGDLLAGGGTSEPQERRRPKPVEPYTALAVAIRAPITPGIYQRSQAYWAARPEEAQGLTPDVQLARYLELATFQHALADEQRPEGEQLYDWHELHMQGIRPLLEAEMQALREEVAQESARGARQAVLARIARFAPQDVLTAIKEMDRE